MCRKCEKVTRVNLPNIVKIPDITLLFKKFMTAIVKISGVLEQNCL